MTKFQIASTRTVIMTPRQAEALGAELQKAATSARVRAGVNEEGTDHA